MKKVLQISIARTLFTIEEDAYAMLNNYITSIREHFKDEEIIADIEGRIAEQLLEKKESIITIVSVEQVIKVMGRVEDFGEETKADEPELERTTGKKIYRDTDNALIAGVSAGLGAYWAINPWWVRLAFIVLSFFNGLGIVIYIVLWLVFPEAKTSAHKLEMAGSPVTLETLSETARERFNEVRRTSNGRIGEILAFPFVVIGRLVRFILRILGPLFRVSVGLMLIVGSLGVLVTTMIMSGFIGSNTLWLTEQVSLAELFPGGFAHYVILGAGMSAIIIPAFFVLLGGISLVLKRSIIPNVVIFTALGVWFIALLISGYGAARIAANFQDGVANRTTIAMGETVIPVEGTFSKLQVEKGIDMTIVRSATTSLTARGRENELPSLKIRVENGTLHIDRVHVVQEKLCLFCDNDTIEITLTVPELSEVQSVYGTSLYSDDFPASDAVRIDLGFGSDGDLTFTTNTAEIDLSQGSNLNLRGTASSTNISLEFGSVLEAYDFRTDHATATASHGSSLELNAEKSLDVTADFGSTVRYSGNATTTMSEEHGSYVRKRNTGSRADEF